MPIRARLLAALAPWAALVALATTVAAAQTPGEAGIRRQIVAAAHEAATAKSVDARAVADLGVGRGNKAVPIYRLEIRIEKGPVLKTDDRRFPSGRWTRQPTNEVVTVGESAWWRAKHGPFREATLVPGLADGTTHEFADLERAARASRELEKIGADRYELTAPATTFNNSEGSSGDLRLVVTLAADGRLHRLRRIEAQGGIGFVADETFIGFSRSFGIVAPPADAIAPGPVEHITTSDGFSKLLGPGPFEGD